MNQTDNDRRRRRSRALIALLLALSLHGGALLWLAGVARTVTLPSLNQDEPDVRVTVRLQAPASPAPVDPPPSAPQPPPPSAQPPSLPRRVAPRPGDAAPAPPPAAPPADEAPTAVALPPVPSDFPRHAWGAPPTEQGAPQRPLPLPPGDDRAVPKVPKRQRTPSLLKRVMATGPSSVLGTGAERKLLAGLTEDGDAQRTSTERKVNGWGTYEGQPGDGLRPGRRLARSERGGFVWVDEETGLPMPDGPQPKHTGWARRFSPSGTNLGLSFDDSPRPRPATVSKDDLVPTDDGGYAYQREGWSARIFPDGAIRFDDDILSYQPGEAPPIYEQLGIPAADLTSGTFDATDSLMRVAGLDPYTAAKSCFIEEVEPIRDELRSAWQQARLEEAIVALRAKLNDTWADEGHSKRERRRAIFNLYDSCNDETAGATARRLITSWVRMTLPEGTPDAFGRVELEAYERDRQGPVAFRPYAPHRNGSEQPGDSSPDGGARG